jgi:hypothetical protein
MPPAFFFTAPPFLLHSLYSTFVERFTYSPHSVGQFCDLGGIPLSI